MSPHPEQAPHTTAFRWKLLAAFAAVYVIWGSTYLAIRFAIETIPPFFMASLRHLTAGCILYAWTRLRGEPRPTLIQWRSAFIVGGMLLLVGNGGVTWAEQMVPSGVTALLIATSPFWFVIFDWLRRGGRIPGRRTILGLALGFAGTVLLVDPAGMGQGGSLDPAGVAVLLLATFSWAAGSLYSRSAPLPASPLLSTAMQMLGGGALLLATSGAAGEFARVPASSFSLRSVGSLLYLVVFGSLVAFTAYVWLLRVTTASRVATYAYVNPVIAVALGWWLAGEMLTTGMTAGAAVIVVAVGLIVTGESGARKKA
ncbi:MAG: EamA family transporter [Bacteroidota bacterium]